MLAVLFLLEGQSEDRGTPLAFVVSHDLVQRFSESFVSRFKLKNSFSSTRYLLSAFYAA